MGRDCGGAGVWLESKNNSKLWVWGKAPVDPASGRNIAMRAGKVPEFVGQVNTIIKRREEIKNLTIQNRRLFHQRNVA